MKWVLSVLTGERERSERRSDGRRANTRMAEREARQRLYFLFSLFSQRENADSGSGRREKRGVEWGDREQVRVED
jgi:hypothetical protein